VKEYYSPIYTHSHNHTTTTTHTDTDKDAVNEGRDERDYRQYCNSYGNDSAHSNRSSLIAFQVQPSLLRYVNNIIQHNTPHDTTSHSACFVSTYVLVKVSHQLLNSVQKVRCFPILIFLSKHL
jgi:hypothetical protein